MFKQKTQYALIITGVALIGCSSPKTITIPNTQPIIGGAIHTNQAPIIQDRIVHYPREIETRVEVPQDIILQENPKSARVIEVIEEPKREEPKVTVPRNNPTLAIKNSTVETRNSSTSTTNNVDRLNGETMDRISFPLGEYRSLKKIGRSTVSGKVYIINSMTDKEVVGSGLKLYLNPVTSYSTQWYNESYLSGYKMSKVDKRLYNYLKFSSSNNNGKFDFFGVAKGKYYLIGSMMCGEECGLGSREKIRLVKEIYVSGGVTKIDLTKRVP